MKYTKVTGQIVEDIKSLVGAENVISNPADLQKYAVDEMPRYEPHLPSVVVKPGDTPAVSKLLHFASERYIPVTPRGAGTGLSGGAVPIYGGILLSTECMNNILEVDEANFTAEVEPGVALDQLQQAVEVKGLYYPLYPGEKTATIGGNIAANAGGMRAVKYGVTRHFVLGIEAVLPSGEVIHSGGKFVKCSTGYDLTQLLIGSEGTLAVITRAILKLTVLPDKREVLFIPFNSLADAISAVPAILREGILPIGIEFMEDDIVRMVREKANVDIPLPGHPAYLLIILEGQTEKEVLDTAKRVGAICQCQGAVDTYIPAGERARKHLLEAREKFYPTIKGAGMVELADIVVPRSRIASFIARVKEISQERGLPIITYGHAGDGNVHLHPFGHNIDRDEWNARLKSVLHDLYQAGASFGGAVSGEHGIGYDKKAYLCTTVDKATLEAMKAIKRAFDPNNIMNPGKIFDLD
ncbi:MAG: FAD-binding oxidoreductase [Chloroflexota bacterium]